MIREIGPSDVEAVTHVVKNMRKKDWAEISAILPFDDRAVFVANVLALIGIKRLVFVGDEPVGCFGAEPQHPGVVCAWLFGTPDFSKSLLRVTSHIRRVIIPELVAQGVHRAHCLSLAEYADTHAWLRLLGAEDEGKKKRYGKNREDFVEFVLEL